MSASGVPPDAASRSRSISVRKIFVSPAAASAEEMGRQLATKRERLKELQRARFTINAIPTMAMLGRSTGASEDNSVWPYLQGDHLVKAGQPSPGGDVIIPLVYKCGGVQRRTENDGQ